jgi:hypothetical protein
MPTGCKLKGFNEINFKKDKKTQTCKIRVKNYC